MARPTHHLEHVSGRPGRCYSQWSIWRAVARGWTGLEEVGEGRVPLFGDNGATMISRVRGKTASAFDVVDGAAALSITRQESPWRASSADMVSPTGPAPTIIISVESIERIRG